MYDDEALLAGFMQPKKRERYREMFNTPRLRKKFINELAHFADFDPAYLYGSGALQIGHELDAAD